MAEQTFQLVSNYQPTGDQPQAIARLVEGVERGDRCQTLLGVTGSGKTTFLGALSEYIPRDERIITIEDNAELKIQGIANLVRLEARAATVNGAPAVSIRDLIRSALRMRPEPHHYEIVRFRA